MPPRPERLVGLLASLVAALVVLAGERSPGESPHHELLFGLMIYLVGPGGLSVASITLVSRASQNLVGRAAEPRIRKAEDEQ